MSDPLRAKDPGKMFPLDYARSICETHVRAGEPFSKALVEELVIELKSYVDGIDEETKKKIELPTDTAEKYIRLFDPAAKVAKKKNRRTIRKRKQGEIYNFALSRIPQFNNGSNEWKTILAFELRHNFPKLPFLCAKDVVEDAFREYSEFKERKPDISDNIKNIRNLRKKSSNNSNKSEKETPILPGKSLDEISELMKLGSGKTDKYLKKELAISTSVEAHAESQDEIEPRLYSFALNFLFNFQDPGKKILRSELIKAINDHIEHFSLKYSAVQKLADKAIAEFREKSKTTPEFKTAYQKLYKTKEAIPSKHTQSHDSRIETIKEEVLTSVSSSKIETKSDVSQNETLPRITTTKKSKIDECHFFILKNIRYVEYPALLIDSFIQKTKKSRATFFRKMNQLERWGLIINVNQGTPRRYTFHPKLLNSSLKFLVVGEGASLTFESTSHFPPNAQTNHLVQDSKSQLVSPSVSISAAAETEPCTSETAYHTTRKTAPISERGSFHPDRLFKRTISSVSNPSKSPKKAGTSETEPKSTNKTASFPEKKEERKDSSKDPRASSDSTTSKSSKERGKSETESETTSKIPSFEELVAQFDPHNIRSHDYLYICEIKRAPKDFRQQLADSTWLESKEGMNNWTWYRGSEKLHNIQCHYHIYTKKVTIQLLEVSSPDPFANNAIADDIAVQVTAYLEDQYPGLVLYDLKRRSRLEVKKLHHAIPNHPIAIRAFELSYISRGKRFGVDDSKGNKEFEAHNHKYSTEDIDNYIEDCDFKAENDYWFRDSAQDIQRNGRDLQKTTEIQKEAAALQKEAAKQIEEVSKNQLWQISGQRHQTEVYQSFINGSMHLIEQNLALQERVKSLEHHLPKISKITEFTKETEMFDPSRTLVEKLQLILEKNPGVTRKQVIKHFGFKKGSIGPTIGRLAKRVNLRENEHRRLFSIG